MFSILVAARTRRAQSGVVPFLLETVGSKDKELQEASAGCLQNIRELALRAEEFKLKRLS